MAAQWRRFGEQPKLEAHFGVGAATAINPLGRSLDTGWSLGGGVGVTGRYLGVLFDFNYTDMGINRETLRFIGAPRGDQKYWSLTVDPIFHVNRRGPVDFYVVGGGGLYSQRSDYRLRFSGPYPDADLLYSNTLYKPGVNGGAGFALQRRGASQSGEDLYGSAGAPHVPRAERVHLHPGDARRAVLSAVVFNQRGGGWRASRT